MFLDSEINQLQHLCTMGGLQRPLLVTGNSFEKKIAKAISRILELTHNNGHDKLPPDFYSDELNLMFDIYRVNDSEIKKTYNPTAIAERNMQHEFEQSRLAQVVPQQAVDNMICIDKDYGSDKIHSITNYIKNINRVTKEHLASNKYPNKIKDIWMQEHPNITRKGLIVYDETENYFQGSCKKIGEKEWQFCWDATKPLTLYKPWMDENVLRQIYESDCDFLIWFMPFKYTGLIQYTEDRNYPTVVVMDTRYHRSNFIKYDYSLFSRT